MFTQAQCDTLQRLMERVEVIATSNATKAKSAHWQRYYAGTPAKNDPEGPIFTMDIGIPTWSKIIGFDINTYFTDTYTQLRCQLEMRIYHAEHFDDDTMVGPGVGVSPLGSALEPAILGAPIDYEPNTVPWVARAEPVINSPADLVDRPQPDFFTAGPMPMLHRMYAETREVMEKLGGGRWGTGFPTAIRGILGLAQTLRGPHEIILLDMLDQPDFARQVMHYVTDFRKHYALERAKFLGETIHPGHIGNDEVTVPVVSPAVYRDFLLPYETELCEFHGGLTCWHSCGDTGPLVQLIRQIPVIKQFYTGPWTNLDQVMAAFGTATPLEIAVHVVDDMLGASPAQMEAKIRQVIRTCGSAPLKLRAGSTDSVFNLQADLAKAKTWCDVARRTTTA